MSSCQAACAFGGVGGNIYCNINRFDHVGATDLPAPGDADGSELIRLRSLSGLQLLLAYRKASHNPLNVVEEVRVETLSPTVIPKTSITCI